MSVAPNIQIPLNFLYDSICEKFKLGNNADDIKAYLRKAGISEGTVSLLLSRYFTEFDVKQQDDVLTETTQIENWYVESSDKVSTHWQRLKGILHEKKNWSPEMIESLDAGSTSVMSRLADPKIITAGGKLHIKGLVLGYVQSGKTANYSAVISKAIDSGYKFILVLAGVHNNLRYQTEARLKEEIVGPNETTCITLTRTDKNGDFSKTESTSANKACGQPQGFSLAVIKKNAAVLRTFNSWLSAAKAEHLEKCPILIIDDESDQASINTSKDAELNPSAINGAIRKIMCHFKVVSYVGYTATPFANMLIDASVEDDLYPRDFFISLRKPPSYTGAEELFGSSDLDGRTISTGLPIIREVAFDEANHVREVSKPKSKEDYNIGPTLKTAIDGFLLSCAWRIARKHWNRHFTMLVHCTQRVAVQQQVFEQVQQHLDDTRFLYQKNSSELRMRLEKLWTDDYVTTTTEIDSEIAIPDFEAIWMNLQNVIDQLQLVLENSASEERLSYEEKFWGIVVGGNTLSRGLTLEGLMTSYFVRTSNYYDSLMQMGRWFGYRRGYLDLIRIYMTEDLKERFFHLADVENEVREEIHTMAENGDRPVDVGIRIRSLPGMTVTNAMKMRSAQTNRVSLSCTKVQPTFHNMSLDALQNNSRTVQILVQNVNSYGGTKVPSKFSRFQDSHLFRGVSPEVILQFLDEFEFSSANFKFSADRIADYVTQATESGELKDWSVAFISKLKASNAVDLGSSVKLGLSDRSIAEGLRSELDPDARYVARVATPIDEFVDLGDLVENCPTDVDAFTKIEGTPHGVGYFRRKYRPKDRGLLLIYAINPDSQLEERTTSSSPYPMVPLKAPEVVYGACFVFPASASDVGTTSFVVNKSIGTVSAKQRKVSTKKKVKDESHQAELPPADEIPSKIIQLSKSRFQAGLQCPKRLFLEVFHHDKKDGVSSAQEAVFEMGNQVGALARQRFANGRLVDWDGFHQNEADKETQLILADSSVSAIYEAAFTFENIKVRVDILCKVGDREVDLIEVKSSTRVKDEHYTDLAIQAHVVEGAGLKVRRCYLMHIDSSYIHSGGDYDLEKLFSLAEVTNEVKDLQEVIQERLGSMWSLLQQKVVPSIETGPQCNKPYQCPFYGHCRKDWPKDHISTLPRASERLVQDLTASGITRIRDIPDSFKGLTVTQKMVRECIVNDRVHYEGEMLRELRNLGRPLFFIDFETINPALPLFKGTRPFQQLPFQWSAHVLRESDAIEHFEYLAEAGKDPREIFATTLLDLLKEPGPIIVYSAFEKACLSAIAKDFPDYADAIENVCGRMIDLLALVRKHFYHPDFGGSFSIKKVLPALVPELSYKGLAIADGATAAMSFAKVIAGNATKEETSFLRKDLLEYCKLDTLAMVRVYQKLLENEFTKQIIKAS